MPPRKETRWRNRSEPKKGQLRRVPLRSTMRARVIENRIKDIEAKMAELGSFWSGDAAVSFNALMSSWQEKATSLNNILIDLSDNLRGTAKDQAANEEDNQSRTSKLQALLG